MTSTQEIFRTLKDMQFENTFNPYFERCPVYDAKNAPEIRRHYLAEMLHRAADTELDAIWVGRDIHAEALAREGRDARDLPGRVAPPGPRVLRARRACDAASIQRLCEL